MPFFSSMRIHRGIFSTGILEAALTLPVRMLFPSFLIVSYGYVANTKVKFVIIVEAVNTALRDGDIRTVCVLFYLIIKIMYYLNIPIFIIITILLYDQFMYESFHSTRFFMKSAEIISIGKLCCEVSI